jgi:hypothetical protein
MCKIEEGPIKNVEKKHCFFQKHELVYKKLLFYLKFRHIYTKIS